MHNSELSRKLHLFLVVAAAIFLTACSAPAAELSEGPIVSELEAGRESGEAVFDHSAYAALLQEHVVAESGRVDYAGFKADEDKLDAYLQRIATADLKTLGEDEQLALLINAYNAYTLKLILENYPLDSIRDLSDPWQTARYVVGSHTLSLDNIEHNLIRPLYKDPRIHFAVNCAARDCPPLRPFAYTGAALDDQLDQVTRSVLSSPSFVRVETDQLHVTRLFEWYGGDFTDDDFHGHASTIPAYIARYTSPEVRSFIEDAGNEPPIQFLDYDWRLNDLPR